MVVILGQCCSDHTFRLCWNDAIQTWSWRDVLTSRAVFRSSILPKICLTCQPDEKDYSCIHVPLYIIKS